MKKILIGVLLLFVLVSCHKKTKICGVWKMETMDVNGTTIYHEQMGMPMIEFNEKGGYLLVVSGTKEKGKYKMDGNSLSLQSVTFPDKPAQLLTITRLDSAQMNYFSENKDGKVNVKLYKVIETTLDKASEKSEEEKEKEEEKENS